MTRTCTPARYTPHREREECEGEPRRQWSRGAARGKWIDDRWGESSELVCRGIPRREIVRFGRCLPIKVTSPIAGASRATRAGERQVERRVDGAFFRTAAQQRGRLVAALLECGDARAVGRVCLGKTHRSFAAITLRQRGPFAKGTRLAVLQAVTALRHASSWLGLPPLQAERVSPTHKQDPKALFIAHARSPHMRLSV